MGEVHGAGVSHGEVRIGVRDRMGDGEDESGRERQLKKPPMCRERGRGMKLHVAARHFVNLGWLGGRACWALGAKKGAGK